MAHPSPNRGTATREPGTPRIEGKRMTKTFCDNCQSELRQEIYGWDKYRAQIQEFNAASYRDRDFCLPCLVKLLQEELERQKK